MTGREAAARGAAVGALVAVALVTVAARRDCKGEPPAEAVGWYGAMELYRTLALWAGKRALSAEFNYWESINRG